MQTNTYRVFYRKKNATSDCNTLVNATSESEAKEIVKRVSEVASFSKIEKVK